MGDPGRVITTKVPTDLAVRLNDVAESMDRTKSWIVRQAITKWLEEEDRRVRAKQG